MAGPFLPRGPTYVVGDEAVHCAGALGGTSYRIRNLDVNGSSYLTWGTTDRVVYVEPAEDAPAENTLGFTGDRTEVVCLPSDAWFISDRKGNFEVTPGEGGM